MPLLASATLAGLLGLAAGPPPDPGDPEAAKARRAPSAVYTPAPDTGRSSHLRGLGLQRARDGSLRYVDPHKRFTARFNDDGTVHFADRWRRPSVKKPGKGKCCALPPGGSGLNPFLGMQFSGPVEWLIALQGKDVLARDKAALLEQTRELRIALAVEHTKAIIERRLGELDSELAAIWASDESPARKRDLLFRRWDECDELVHVAPQGVPAEALSEIDRVRIEAAQDARGRIERFVRRHAPEGHVDAYPTTELRGLNAERVSDRAFAPYVPENKP